MRGKGDPAARTSTCTRITPAYAGKSSAFIRSSPVNQDHPRLCGEKSAEIMAEHDAEGITPAYAGKRVPKIPQTQRTRDHPRLCGEKTKKIPKQRYFFHQPASFSFSLQYT